MVVLILYFILMIIDKKRFSVVKNTITEQDKMNDKTKASR